MKFDDNGDGDDNDDGDDDLVPIVAPLHISFILRQLRCEKLGCPIDVHHLESNADSEMQKAADAADISVLFFQLVLIFGPFRQFLVIFGPIWAILGCFG